MKVTKSQIKELIRHAIVELTEKTFGSQAQYDAYRKKHNLKPGSKHKVAGKTVTVRDTKKMSKKAKSLGDKMADKLNKRMADLEKKRKQGKIKESKQRRYTVKEVRMWMKKLEENRYKKVYNSDARRVAWMVNNEGVELSEMPKSMSKKWTKAQYGRERYLATEFLKSKSEQMNEGKLTEDKFIAFYKKDKVTVTAKSLWDAKKQIIAKLKVPKKDVGLVSVLNKTEYDKQKFRFEQKLRESIREIIKEQMDEKINLGGAYEKMLDKHNDKLAQNALSLVRNKIMKDYKVGKKSPKSSETVTRRLVATLINNGMKEIRNKAKSPGLKKAFQKIIDMREKNLKKMKEEKVNEAYRSQSIFFDKKDKSKLQKLLKKNKGKFPFNPPGEPVVNWSITHQGSKGLEWRGIPKSKYDKAVEFFMKNKLNPRG